MTTTSPTPAGLHLRIEHGSPSVESDDRWSCRSDSLAAWLVEQYRRQHPPASTESEPANLDPSACSGIPRQATRGEVPPR